MLYTVTLLMGYQEDITTPYRGDHLTQQQQDYNRSMSPVRISVEWTFGMITQCFRTWISREIPRYYSNLLVRTT